MARTAVPSLEPSAGKAPIIVRLDSAIVADLRAAARQKGWSLSEEIEDRIRATLAEETVMNAQSAPGREG
jgi:hypothetical protein